MKIKIGKIEGKNFEIDADVLADTRAIVCASSGGGKSHLLRLIAEDVGEKIQTVIFDPEGEFPTLREGLDILVVGESGDLQVDIKSAKLLARKIAETGVSVVIDIYDIPGEVVIEGKTYKDPWDKRRWFVAEFIGALMNLPKSMYHPMLVIVDEAHQFAPEGKGGEAATASRSAINSLMSAGRKRGIGGILATQRISKIHKDSIADARNVFIGGTTLDIDQERAGDMLGMSKKDSVTLRDLAPGEFFCYGPATGARGVFKFQSNPVKTTHPKAGQRSSIVVPKASSHITEIASQFGDLPTQAKQEADEIETLKRENSRLSRELTQRPVQLKPEVKYIEREIPIIKGEDLEGMANLVLAMNELGGHFSAEVKKFQNVFEVAKTFKANVSKPTIRLIPSSPEMTDTVHLPTPKIFGGVSPAYRPIGDGIKLPKAETKILTILSQYPDGRSINQIAILTGYAIGTGGFNNAMGALRTAGYISGGKDNLQITEPGREALGPYEILPSGDALLHLWMGKLGKAEKAVLATLEGIWPEEAPQDWVSEQAGYAPGTGGVNNAIGRLKTLELIVSTGPKMLKMNDTLRG